MNLRTNTVAALAFLGGWLALSALWDGSMPQRIDSAVVGLGVIALAFAAHRRMRLAFQGSAVLGLWALLAPAVMGGHSALLTVTNMVLGTAIFGFAAAAIGALSPQPILRHRHH